MARAGVFEGIILIILVLLCAVVFVMVTDENSRISDKGNWSIAGDGPVSKIFMSDDGSLYLFGGANGSTIYAIGMNGDKKWTFEVPGQWMASKQAIAVDDGTIYLYLYEFNDLMAVRYGGLVNYLSIVDQGYMSDGNRSIMAISGHGKMLWHKNVPNGISYYGTSIYADSGRVYYYNNDSVMAIDRNGRTLFNVSGIYGPPTIDEHGNIFVARMLYENGGFGPGQTIEAYHPDGTLYWRNDLGRKIYGMSNYGEIPPFNSILFYKDDSLYAWVDNGTVKLSTNGSIIWSKTFPYNGCVPLQAMPIDSQGNMYYLFYANPPYIDVVTPDGREILRDYTPHNATFRGNEDGVVYYVDYYFNNTTFANVEREDLMLASISAYNILEDRYLWNYTLAPDASEMLIKCEDADFVQSKYSIYYVFPGMATIPHSIHRFLDTNVDEQAVWMPGGVICNWGLRLAHGADALYLNYYSFNWQFPIIDNRSTYFYANSLYAIADNGTMLWEKPMSSLVTSMAANNSTLYYSTRDGGFFVENAARIGGGLALLAIVYMAARFLLVGSVARARSRIETNQNRNSVMRYIADNPGFTARDIARGLNGNLGTIRYHLFILGLNHKIVTYQADGKFLRYFTNSKSYSEAEQHAVSIVRRDGMRKVLGLLIEKPGLTGREISQSLDMQESAVSRNLRELQQNGIVAKCLKADGSPAYSIEERHRRDVSFALDRVKN